MPALSKARDNHTCTNCRQNIRKGQYYVNKPRYNFGVDKYCIDCIKKEIAEI